MGRRSAETNSKGKLSSKRYDIESESDSESDFDSNVEEDQLESEVGEPNQTFTNKNEKVESVILPCRFAVDNPEFKCLSEPTSCGRDRSLTQNVAFCVVDNILVCGILPADAPLCFESVESFYAVKVNHAFLHRSPSTFSAAARNLKTCDGLLGVVLYSCKDVNSFANDKSPLVRCVRQRNRNSEGKNTTKVPFKADERLSFAAHGNTLKEVTRGGGFVN